MADAGQHDFEALPASYEAAEQRAARQAPSSPNYMSDGVGPDGANDDGAAGRRDYLRDGPAPPGVDMGGGVSDHEEAEENDRVPLTRELSDFSHGFNPAVQSMQEDGGEAAPPTTSSSAEASYPGPRRNRNGGGILWQQNRRQTRNPMWM